MQKNRLIKKLCIILIPLYLLSCLSSQYRPYTSIKGRRTDFLNRVPRFTLLDDIHWKARPLASQDLSKSSFVGFSNKQVYFSTLFWQFQKLKAFRLGPPLNILSCPSFHSTFLELKKESPSPRELHVNGQVLKKWIDLKPQKEIMALFPEMALPLTHASDAPTLYKVLRKYPHRDLDDLLSQGIKIHTEKTYRELQQLCHVGHGQNYFIFENLITYVHQNPHFKNGAIPLLSLLESTVFFNFILLEFFAPQQQLKNVTIHSNPVESKRTVSKFEKEMIFRLQANWSYNYFYQFRQRRLALFKNVEAVSSTHDGQVFLRR